MTEQITLNYGIPFDYVLIDCGYGDRLLNFNRLDAVQKILDSQRDHNIKMICVLDSYGLEKGYEKIGDGTELKEFKKTFPKKYSIVFRKGSGILAKCRSYDEAMILSEAMMEQDHCAFFDHNNTYDRRYIDIDNKRILIVSYDTESG